MPQNQEQTITLTSTTTQAVTQGSGYNTNSGDDFVTSTVTDGSNGASQTSLTSVEPTSSVSPTSAISNSDSTILATSTSGQDSSTSPTQESTTSLSSLSSKSTDQTTVTQSTASATVSAEPSITQNDITSVNVDMPLETDSSVVASTTAPQTSTTVAFDNEPATTTVHTTIRHTTSISSSPTSSKTVSSVSPTNLADGSKNTPNSSKRAIMVAVITVTALIAAALLAFLGYKLYKKHQTKKNVQAFWHRRKSEGFDFCDDIDAGSLFDAKSIKTPTEKDVDNCPWATGRSESATMGGSHQQTILTTTMPSITQYEDRDSQKPRLKLDVSQFAINDHDQGGYRGT